MRLGLRNNPAASAFIKIIRMCVMLNSCASIQDPASPISWEPTSICLNHRVTKDLPNLCHHFLVKHHQVVELDDSNQQPHDWLIVGRVFERHRSKWHGRSAPKLWLRPWILTHELPIQHPTSAIKSMATDLWWTYPLVNSHRPWKSPILMETSLPTPICQGLC